MTMIHYESGQTFRAWRSSPTVMPGAHVHTDIELNLLLSGKATYFLAGRVETLFPGQLAVFWAGMPHRLTAVESQTEYFCMALPVAWFLAWELEKTFSQRLMRGELVREENGAETMVDPALFARWVEDTREPNHERYRIALLEVEARLRRMALATPVIRSVAGGRSDASSRRGEQVERIAAYVGDHYRDITSIEEIGQALGQHPNYLMTVFKEGSGLSLWEYLTRLRVSHAQRLLLTTDWTVDRIGYDCGFGSLARFFVAFKRVCGTTPRRYRRST